MPIKFNMLLFAGIPWALWNTRNKMAIEHITPRSPLQVFHHGIIFVQKWCQLLKATDQDKMREVVERLKAGHTPLLQATLLLQIFLSSSFSSSL